MKNWQDYATDADSGIAPTLPPRNQDLPPRDTVRRIPGAWLILNIALSGLCVVSLIYGLFGTIISSSPVNFAQFIGNVAITFVLPGAWLTQLYLTIVGKNATNGMGLAILSIFVSPVLGLLLIFNAIMALRYFLKHFHGSRRNLIFATIPPVFVIIVLILLLLCHPWNS